MKNFVPIAILTVLALCFSWTIVFAQEDGAPSQPADKNGFARYLDYASVRIDEIADKSDEYWGATTLLVPEGIFSVKFEVNYKRANTRWGSDGKRGPLIDPITLDDPLGVDDDFFKIDFNAKGHMTGYQMSFYYGVSDPIDIYATFAFQTEEFWLNVDFDPGSSSMMGIRTKADLYELFELLGRPRPKSHYKSKTLEAGDFHFGLFWNYFRNQYFSALIRPRVVLPTGRQADPNSALIFALGPEIDVGKGSFGPGITHSFDLRGPAPIKFVSLGTEVDYNYYLRGRHRAPRFIEPDPNTSQAMNALGVDTTYFPDLSGLDDYYFVTPGHSIDATSFLTFTVPFVSFGAAYNFVWNGEPIVETSSRAFADLMDAFDSYNSNEMHTLAGLISVQLFRIKIPAAINFESRFPIAGKNQLRFQDDYKGDIQLFFPF